MNSRFDISLMINVAQMYYLDGLKQDEIAKQLQISRSLISMILTEAKDLGIVEIKVKNPLVNHEYYSYEIEKHFNLDKCFIVPTSVKEKEVLRRLSVKRAIEIFNKEVKNNYNIGITWGRTCYEFIQNYEIDRKLSNVNIIPLIGGSNQDARYFQLNEMVRIFAEKIGGKPNFIYAPALTSSEKEKEFYMKSQSLMNVVKKWYNLDIIISGIGSLPNDTKDREIYVGEHEIYSQLDRNEAIGDISLRYFDTEGNFLPDSYYKKVIVIPVNILKKSKKLICIASGLEKSKSIIGALKSDVINFFISDEQTAKTVVDIL